MQSSAVLYKYYPSYRKQTHYNVQFILLLGFIYMPVNYKRASRETSAPCVEPQKPFKGPSVALYLLDEIGAAHIY